MQRIALALVALLGICASLRAEERLPAPASGPAAVTVSITRSGAVSIDRRPVPLRRLVATLRTRGISARSGIAVVGEKGTSYRHISRVMETLARGGLLPRGTID